jgi:hypothetical protein
MKNLILILVLPLIGCSSIKQQPNIDLPEGIHDLLHVGENYAYKSITIKDYTEPKEVN